MPPPPAQAPVPPPAPSPVHRQAGAANGRDDTTRYLCAAAHLNPRYANGAIREFLTEPTRPVPPSPGVDAAAVLSEAVAARTRRKLRDIALLLLTVPLLFTAPAPVLAVWVGLAVAVSLVTSGAAARHRPPRGAATWVGILAAAAVVLLMLGGPGKLFGSQNPYGSLDQYGFTQAPADHSVKYSIAVLLAAAILAVLVADRQAVWSLLTRRFRRSDHPQSGTGSGAQLRQIHDFGHRSFLAQLERYQRAAGTVAADSGVPLIVYRGYSPFVGAGQELHPWSTALTLTTLPEEDQPSDGRELTTAALYRRTQEELADLSRSTPLTPGRRLRELKVAGQVIVSAHELVDNLPDPRSRTYLAGRDVAPNTAVPYPTAEALKVDPLEWARYYLCFQVETWDRDLVVSVYLHMAVDANTLYVEWTPCVLTPIAPTYQRIDSLATSSWTPFGQALLKFLELPASLPRRVAHTCSFIRPLRTDRGADNPDRYGSLRSLREMATDGNVQNYFQRADVDRYLKILESRFILAVGRILREFGYSSYEFEQQAAVVVNQSMFISGNNNFNAPVTVGRVGGNISSSGSMTTPTSLKSSQNFNAPIVSGGTVHGNISSHGDFVVQAPSGQPADQQLSALLAALRAQVVTAGAELPKQEVILDSLDDLADDVEAARDPDRHDPDQAVARSRWRKVMTLLEGATRITADLATIGTNVAHLFGTG
jgi:hypothetical protein